MDIEVGSKWVRVSGLEHENSERFIGQEVEVVPYPVKMPHMLRLKVWIRRENKGGFKGHPVWMDETEFLSHFSPLNISLENK